VAHSLLVNNDFNNFDMLNIYPNLINQLEVKNHFIKKGSK